MFWETILGWNETLCESTAVPAVAAGQ